MTKRYFSAPSEAQAVLEAAAEFGVSPEELAYEGVSRKGSLRARTKSIIVVDDEAPLKPAVDSVSATAQPAPAPVEAEQISEPPAVIDVAIAEDPVEGEAVAASPAAEALPEPQPEPQAETRAEPRGGDEAEEVTAPSATAEVAARKEEAAVAAPEASQTAAAEQAGAPAMSQGEAAEAIRSSVDLLLDLADLDVDPAVDMDREPPLVNLNGPDREWLLDGEGDLLLSFEHLAGRMLYRGGCPVDRVRVDSDGFREAQDEALRERTRKALVESRESGRPVVFEPLGPAERRVIHLAVESSGEGWSRSEGSGFRRRVRIEANPVEVAEESMAETAAEAEQGA